MLKFRLFDEPLPPLSAMLTVEQRALTSMRAAGLITNTTLPLNYLEQGLWNGVHDLAIGEGVDFGFAHVERTDDHVYVLHDQAITFLSQTGDFDATFTSLLTIARTPVGDHQ